MSSLRMIATKAALRREVLAARAEAHRDGARRAKRAADLALDVLDIPSLLENGSRVAGYRPIRTEIDPGALLLALHKAGVPLAMPVVIGAARPLSFRPWHPGAAEVEGAFGAPIPADETDVTPDVLIVPLVAFDAGCARLGYGGGFYDRTIERLTEGARPLMTVGMAYAAQQVGEVPREDTDKLLDAVVTEAGVVRRREDPAR
ncbi:MAG: 5-formyltetrahydrofolate cyclo-ligase [Pseudomonadota bacterium]